MRGAIGAWHELELRRLFLLQEHAERTRDALDTEQIVSVRGHVDLVHRVVRERLRLGRLATFPLLHRLLERDIVQFDTKLEAEMIELIDGPAILQPGQDRVQYAPAPRVVLRGP